MEIPKHINWPGWEVVRKLGSGSFGAVYEIQRDLYGKAEYAALKVISIPQDKSDIDELYADGYDKESITLRFRSYLEDIVREYAMMAEMKGHANIVYCDDLRQVPHEDGIGWDIYIKMELLTPLVQALPVEIPEEQVIRLGADICNALILCKQRNIIHRDIKPQNIFVSRDGNYKLGDFGIAKTAEKTSGGTKTGTYKYMAPEVYKAEPYGTSVDLYSLGLVLYWMLNERRTPFLPLPPKSATTYQEDEAKRRRFSGEPLPPPVHGSKELQAIVLKACAAEPKDRFKSAAEMHEALLALQHGDKARLAALVTLNPQSVPQIEEATVRSCEMSLQERTVSAWQSIPQPLTEATIGVYAQRLPESLSQMQEEATVSVHAQTPKPRARPIPYIPQAPYMPTNANMARNTQAHPSKAQPVSKKNSRKPVWIFSILALVLIVALAGWLIMAEDDSVSEDNYRDLYQHSENTAETPTTEAPTTEAPTIETPTTEPPVTEAPTFAMNIALVTDVGNIDDKSFNQGAWEGVVAYAEANGVPYNYYRPSEDSDVARIESIDTAIANGANVVVCPGYLFETSVYEVQSTYPEVKFLLLDGEPHTADYVTYETKSNTMNILYCEEQAGYMAGYAAVKDGYRHLGFIGGIEVPAVIRFGFGFVQGANAAAVELGVEGEVDVKYWYSGTFSPDDAIKTKAAGWYTAGTEVIFACGGGIYVSICAAADEAGKAVIGVDKDQSFESERIVTSAMKNLTASVELALTELAANGGEWSNGGQTIRLGAAENCVGLPTAESSWRLQNYTVAEYETLFAAIANGTIAVSDSLDEPEVAITVDYSA